MAIDWGPFLRWGAGSGAVRFASARPDAVTWMQLGLAALVLLALVVAGALAAAAAARVRDWSEVGRGAGFAVLGLGLAWLMVARMPASYRVILDDDHGPVLEIRRIGLNPVRLRLGAYQEAVRCRMLFPWLPLFSGTRLFGLRGARIEELILGVWSFGCDGRRSVVLRGAGRPTTLVSPTEPERFMETVGRYLHGDEW